MASDEPDLSNEIKKQMYTIIMNPNQKFLRSKMSIQNVKNKSEVQKNFTELLSAHRIPRAKIKMKPEPLSAEKPIVVFTKYDEDLNAKYNLPILPYTLLNDISSFGFGLIIIFPLHEKMKYNRLLLNFNALCSRCVLIPATIDNEQIYNIKEITNIDKDNNGLVLNDLEDMSDTPSQYFNLSDFRGKDDTVYLIEYSFYNPKEEALCFIVSDLVNRKQLISVDDEGGIVYSGFLIREDFKFYKSSFSMDIPATSLEDLGNTLTSITMDIIIKGYKINNIYSSFLFGLEYKLLNQNEDDCLTQYILHEALINKQLCLIFVYYKEFRLVFVRYYSSGQFEWIELTIHDNIYINQIKGKAIFASIIHNKSSFWNNLRFEKTNQITPYDDSKYDSNIIIPKSGLFNSFECGRCMYAIGQFKNQICYSCLQVFHIKCLEDNYKSLLLGDFYFCEKCRICSNCKTNYSPDNKLLCVLCSKAYHFQCICEQFKSSYLRVDPKTFKCENCLNCSQCKCTPWTISSINKFNQSCDMCIDCERRRSKKEYCPICNQIWRSQETQLIECKCKFWIHRECDRVLNDVYYSHIIKKNYHCSICRIKKKNKRVYDILKQLSDLDENVFFINPVDTKHIPNYSKVIKTPMCFQQIETRIRENNYYLNDMNMLFADVNLIFDNAMVFNKPNDYIYKVAYSLKIECNKILNENYSFLYQMSFEYYLFEYYQPDLIIDQLHDIINEKFPQEIFNKINIEHIRNKINEYDVKWSWLNEYGFSIVLKDRDLADNNHLNQKIQTKVLMNSNDSIGQNTPVVSSSNNVNSYKYKSFKTNEIQLELDLHNSNFEAPRKSSRIVYNSSNPCFFNAKMEINENGFDFSLPLKEEDDMVMKEYDHARLSEKKLNFLYPSKYKEYSIKCGDRSSYLDFISSFLSHKEEKKKNGGGSPKNNNKKMKQMENNNKKYEDDIISFQSDLSYEKKKKNTKKKLSNKLNHKSAKANQNSIKGNQIENHVKAKEPKNKSREDSIKNNYADSNSNNGISSVNNQLNKKEMNTDKGNHSTCYPCQICFASIELILEKNCFLCGSFEDQDSLIICAICFENYHYYCVSSSLKDTSRMELYNWKCQNCKICEKCNSNTDLTQMLYCKICDKATHSYCLTQSLSTMPQCNFKCEACFECLNCQNKSYYKNTFLLKKDKDYSFFTRNFDYCYECGIRLFYNSLCSKCKISDYKNFDKKISFIATKDDFMKQLDVNYYEEDKGRDVIMLYCFECKSWYHSKCIGFDLICITNYFQRFDSFKCLDCWLKLCYNERYNDLAYVSYLEVLKLSFKVMCFTKIAMTLLKSYQNDSIIKLHSKLIKIFLKDNYDQLLKNKSISMLIELMKIDVYILRDKKQKKKKKKTALASIVQDKSIIDDSSIIHNDSLKLTKDKEKEIPKEKNEEKKLPIVIMKDLSSIEQDYKEPENNNNTSNEQKEQIKEYTKEELQAQIERIENEKLQSSQIPLAKKYVDRVMSKYDYKDIIKFLPSTKTLNIVYDINTHCNKKIIKNKFLETGMSYTIKNISTFVNRIKQFNNSSQNEANKFQSISIDTNVKESSEPNNNISIPNESIPSPHMNNEDNYNAGESNVKEGDEFQKRRLIYKGEGNIRRAIISFFNKQNEVNYYNGNIPNSIPDFYLFDLDKYYSGLRGTKDTNIDNNNSNINNSTILNEVMQTCLSFITIKQYSPFLKQFISKIVLNAIIVLREKLVQWLITQLTSTDMALFKDTINDDPSEEELSKYLDQIDPLTPSPNKNQECEFCGRKGGRARSGRLIYLKSHMWGHINCIYWSKGVIAEPTGLLTNLNSSLNKITQSKCLLCKKSGATVICRVPKCGRPFHFMCAVTKGFTFTKDNEVYCNRCTHCQKDDSNISSLETKKLFQVDKKYDTFHYYKYQIGYYNKFGNSTILKFIQINSKDLSYENIDIAIAKHINDHILLFLFNDNGALIANCPFANIKEFEEYALKTNLLNCYSKTEANIDELSSLTSFDVIKYSPLKNDFVLSLNYCLNKQERNESIASLFSSMNNSLHGFITKTVCDNSIKPKDSDDVLKFFNFYFELNRIFSNQPDLYLKQNIEIDQFVLRNGIHASESIETKQKKNLKNHLELFAAQIKEKNKTPDIDDNVKLQYSICFKFDNYIQKHQQFLTGRRSTVDIEMKDGGIPQEDIIDKDIANQGTKQQKQTYKNLNKTMSTNIMEADIPLSMKFRNYKLQKPKVLIGPSRIHRNGLFATDNFQPGEIVIEYVGEMITNKVADYREKEYNLRGFGDCYMFRVDTQTIIDATKFGNLARFINHSCDPNCSAQSNEINGKMHIILYAKRMIKSGEEITYDYNFESETEKIQCRCGAQNCQGRLN